MLESNVNNNQGLKYKLLLLDFVYLAITYIWLIVFPLSGEDYITYLNFHKECANIFISDLILNPILIRCANILLCYANMVLIFFITKKVLKGVWWLGSLSAVMFMAHPVMNLNISQPVLSKYLLFLLISLSVVYLNLTSVRKDLLLYLIFLIYSIITIFIFPTNAILIILSFLFGSDNLTQEEYISKRFLIKIGDFFLLTFTTVWVILNNQEFYFSPDIFPQASVLIYPLGWLKESQEFYQLSPLIPFISSVGLVLFLGLIGFWQSNKAIIKLFLSFVLMLMFPIEKDIDLFQTIRNAHLIYPLVFGSIAFAGICGELQKLPRWNSPIIKGTAILCLIMITFQFYLHFQKGYGIFKEKTLLSKVINQIKNSQCDIVSVFPEEIRTRWSSINLHGQVKQSLPTKQIYPLGIIENYENINYIEEVRVNEDKTLSITLRSPQITKLDIRDASVSNEKKNITPDSFLIICNKQDEVELMLTLENLSKNDNICILVWDMVSTKLQQIRRK